MKMVKFISAAAIAAALFFLGTATPDAHAAGLGHGRAAQKDLTPALQQSLQDMLSDVTGPYFDAESEKKAKGQKYTDLQQKFEYLPTYGPHNQLVVSCKLGGAEYDPSKPGSTKGAATGTLKYLVFTYALENKKWVSIAKPKWEQEVLGAAAGKKMTGHQQVGDQRKEVIEKAKQTKANAAAAAAAAQKAADRSTH